MKSILITGARGFIGQNFVKKISDSGEFDKIYCVYSREYTEGIEKFYGVKLQSYQKEILTNLGNQYIVVDDIHYYFLDLSRTDSVSYLPKTDVVVHLAANPLVKPNPINPNKIWMDNVIATNNLINHCKDGAKFIFASTVTVYGDSFGSCPEYINCKPTSAYALTKITSEELLKLAKRQNKINPVILRICANVGLHSTHGVVHDFIRKIRENPKQLEVLGSRPGSSKPYLHVSDVVDALYKAISYEPVKGQFTEDMITFNIANDDNLNIEQLANAVLSAMGQEREIVWLGDGANWVGDNKLIKIDSRNAHNHLKWYPKYNSSYQAVVQGVKDILNVDTR